MITIIVRLTIVASVLFFGVRSYAFFNSEVMQRCQIIDNDEDAQFCAESGYSPKSTVWNTGIRRNFYSFETISENFTPEIENDYEFILMANTAAASSASSTDFIPPQTMLVLQKGAGAKKFFTRDQDGIIDGLESTTLVLSDIIGTDHVRKIKKSSRKEYGMPFDHNGLEVVPVSTGASRHMLSFSGIFQMNWGRSKPRKRRGWGNPMSNPIYFGYYYSNTNGGPRTRVSYAAFHGTPKKNWKLLGKSRDSHGCTRVHPAVMEDIRAHIESMPDQLVYELDWDWALPVQDSATPFNNKRPVLLMTFNGYESKGA